ncbi:MAG: hypothetical protein IPG58_17615 [Acidobacteria bacterium]|nr:hypothetical protein [Acidobacteriota bacterium]
MKKRSLVIALATVLAITLTGCEVSVGTNITLGRQSWRTRRLPIRATRRPPRQIARRKPNSADEKKPEGKAKSAKKNPVPDSWVYVYDDRKARIFVT